MAIRDFDLKRREANMVLVGAALAAASPARALIPDARPGFKVTEFLRAHDALSRDALLLQWETDRAPLLLDLPGIRGLSFNQVDPSRSPDASFDGIVEMWFTSETAYRHAFDEGDPELLQALAYNWRQFADGPAMGFTTSEIPIVTRAEDRPRGTAKRIGLVGRHPGTSEASFFDDWLGHAHDAAEQPGLCDYYLNFRTGVRLPSMAWDGYAEMWWTDWETFEAARTTIQPGLAHRLAFFDAHELFYVEEHVAMEPSLG
ncbi:EthD domain-containing protein [Parasphingopyxis marina]|uniref:EthD family reductase n=1 Tax=Parasphingopyxis marina TaxID=2761622 RepID=A0A842HX54_9SPHN|nr:EthD family reductase [Parasphingopyxis marina]MBC2777043.1 EthD family reductase [Parasphingopyxis marina]